MPEDQVVLSDPALDICPDYTHEDYQQIRNILAASMDNSQERAIEALEALWRKETDRKKIIWARQQLEEDEPANNSPLSRQPSPIYPSPDKKKRPNIVSDLSNLRSDRPRPSAFALRKLEAFEYVELWYFSTDGCADACFAANTSNDEALGLIQAEDGITLQKVPKRSKKAVQDESLTWEQLSIAKGNFLFHIQYVTKWPEPIVASFSTFYFNLDNHPIKAEPLGNETLLHYHAQVRRDWFDTFKRSPTGDTFNISIIDKNILLDINARLQRNANNEERVMMRRERTRFGSYCESSLSVSFMPHLPPSKRPRSKSPSDVTPSKRRQPDQSFPAPTDKLSLPACAICLSRNPHDICSCEALTLWDDSPSYAWRSAQDIIDPDESPPCLDWNQKRFFEDLHESKHACSGCGGTDHGAQECPRAEEAYCPHSP
jgi:hypothetical protein